jgi:hypothetical protein
MIGLIGLLSSLSWVQCYEKNDSVALRSYEEDATVAEMLVDPVVGTEEELSNGGVEPFRLLANFSKRVFHLLLGSTCLYSGSAKMVI